MHIAHSFAIALIACVTLLIGSVGSGGEGASLRITSDAFEDGKPIPQEFTCDGADRSPPLHWDGAPEKSKALALVVDDPDAPSGNWNHWLIYNMPPATRALGAGVAATAALGDGSRQGTNDFGRIGYGGPCPPPGSKHRYVFKLYALSAPLELEPGAKRDAVMKAVKEKTLAEAQVVGRYGR